MKCPVCAGVDLKMSERQGVEIDYCPECRGVWLDRGELDKIIERSGVQPAAYVQPEPQQRAVYSQQQHGRPHHDQHGYGHGNGGYHKKKNWLTELFD